MFKSIDYDRKRDGSINPNVTIIKVIAGNGSSAEFKSKDRDKIEERANQFLADNQ